MLRRGTAWGQLAIDHRAKSPIDGKIKTLLTGSSVTLATCRGDLCVSQKIEESRCFDKLSMTILGHFVILKSVRDEESRVMQSSPCRGGN